MTKTELGLIDKSHSTTDFSGAGKDAETTLTTGWRPTRGVGAAARPLRQIRSGMRASATRTALVIPTSNVELYIE